MRCQSVEDCTPKKNDGMLLTRYEVTRIVGLRALQLDAGAKPAVEVKDERLRCDACYVAALELSHGLLDVIVRRSGADVHVRDVRMPPELNTLLDTKDGGSRGVHHSVRVESASMLRRSNE